MWNDEYTSVPEEGYNTKNSALDRVGFTLAQSYTEPYLLDPTQSKQDRENIHNSLNGLQDAINRSVKPGIGGDIANFAAGLVGSSLNPIALGAGIVGGGIAGKLVEGGVNLAAKALPEGAAKWLTTSFDELTEKALPKSLKKESVASITKKNLHAFGTLESFNMPIAMADNYRAKTDKFDWVSAVKSSTLNSGLWMGAGNLSYLGGIMWRRLFPKGAKEGQEIPMPGKSPIPEQELHDKMVNQNFSPESREWLKSYLFEKSSKGELSEKANNILSSEGHYVDPTNYKALFKIFSPEDVKTIQTVYQDSLLNALPDSERDKALNYFMNNSVDKYLNNTEFGNGLEGVVTNLKEKLKNASSDIADFKDKFKKYLPENMREKNPLKQSEIYKRLHAGESLKGAHIPHEVETLLKHDEKIRFKRDKLSKAKSSYAKKSSKLTLKRIKNHEDSIKELMQDQPKLLAHPEELEKISADLIKDNEVINNFESHRSYHRLHDLTKVRSSARQLMGEVHLLNEKAMQENYANMLKVTSDLIHSNVAKLANPEDLNSYFKSRLEQQLPEYNEDYFKKHNEDMEKSKAASGSPSFHSDDKVRNVVADLEGDIVGSDASELKKDFDDTKAKYEEFKDNESLFSNLIKCVEGKING